MIEIAALSSGIFLGAVVSGFAGFAFSAVAGAVLLHFFDPLMAVPLMMVCSLLSQVSTLVVLRRIIRWREISCLLLGGSAGVLIAADLFTMLDSAVLQPAFGTMLVLYSVYLLGARRRSEQRADSLVTRSAIGFFGGIVGTFTAMPGAVPAIWCELQGHTKEQQRGLVQPFIVSMQALTITVFLLKPGFPRGDVIHHTLIALPALALGSGVGLFLYGKISDSHFRRAVLALLMVSGLGMISWKVLPLS